MQRVKGQSNQGGVRNGSENNKHDNVNSWVPHPEYGSQGNVSVATGAYSIPNYYGTSYFAQYCMSDGTINYAANFNGQIPCEGTPVATTYSVDGVYDTAAIYNPAPAAAAYNYYTGGTAEFNDWANPPPPIQLPVPAMSPEYYHHPSAPVTNSLYNGLPDPNIVKGIDYQFSSLTINNGGGGGGVGVGTSSGATSTLPTSTNINTGIVGGGGSTTTSTTNNHVQSTHGAVHQQTASNTATTKYNVPPPSTTASAALVATAATTSAAATAPPPENKTTSWASIAKKPTKPTPQVASTSSKKKGPGMPPPPMLPSRLNDTEPEMKSQPAVPKTPVVQAPPPPASAASTSLPSKPVWNGPLLSGASSSTSERPPTSTMAPSATRKDASATGPSTKSQFQSASSSTMRPSQLSIRSLMDTNVPPPNHSSSRRSPSPTHFVSRQQQHTMSRTSEMRTPSPPSFQRRRRSIDSQSPTSSPSMSRQNHNQRRQSPSADQYSSSRGFQQSLSPQFSRNGGGGGSSMYGGGGRDRDGGSFGGNGGGRTNSFRRDFRDKREPSPPPAARPAVVEKVRDRSSYNPNRISIPPTGTRFFVIKSYSEDDVHRSIKYEIWCSTEHGNRRLDDAFIEQQEQNRRRRCRSDSYSDGEEDAADENSGPGVYLFYSVNGSGHFCGVAKMMSSIDYNSSSSVWAQDKWKGQFKVRWLYVKDVPNTSLRHIRIESNENKPVTNSRDATEIPYDKGVAVLRVIHDFDHSTSLFDDFNHYDQRQVESTVAPKSEYRGAATGGDSRGGGSSYNGFKSNSAFGGGAFGGRGLNRNNYRDRDDGNDRNDRSYSSSYSSNGGNNNRRGPNGMSSFGGGAFSSFRNGGSSFSNSRNNNYSSGGYSNNSSNFSR